MKLHGIIGISGGMLFLGISSPPVILRNEYFSGYLSQRSEYFSGYLNLRNEYFSGYLNTQMF